MCLEDEPASAHLLHELHDAALHRRALRRRDLHARLPERQLGRQHPRVPLLLDDGAILEDGTQVCMRGYFGSDDFPLFLSGSTASATVLGPSLVQELLIVLPVVPGQSGSPLISVETGRVVGVLTAIVPVSLPFNQQPAHSGLARAVEVVHVKKLVESLGK